MARTLPIHSTKRHPLTGEPLQAIWVSPTGRAFWPVIGASPDDDGAAATTAADAANVGAGNATDESGRDLGFPANTPVAEMTDRQGAAYWKHQARKHEGTWKGIVGDRTVDDVKQDLATSAEAKKAQQTASEQQIEEARRQGEAAGTQNALKISATAIFKGSLEAAGIQGDDLDELVESFKVERFIEDNQVDTTKITNFAKRFTPAGTGGQQQRDFGGGKRHQSAAASSTQGRSQAERRGFVKPQTTT